MAGRTEGITHKRTDEGIFYSPPPPVSDDNDTAHNKLGVVWLSNGMVLGNVQC